ncbi:ABC transporter substrate-binding protein [Paenibacillus sp. GbtcB18]|uniref:ABC transporter substrate-binding protein n=1 Tax=Paenibacillus sp. GbtcB18 TaxID=2824763 RepID=UPI001C300CEE|nr:ABC transporter substrate-binding protein [Paenibacillus sp. GbtcB18]
MAIKYERWLSMLVIVSALMLVSGCSFSSPLPGTTTSKTFYPLKLTDSCGRDVVIPHEPQTVTVLDSWENDFMETIGAGHKSKPFMGGIGPSIEAMLNEIKAEKTDLVLIDWRREIDAEISCTITGKLARNGVPVYAADQTAIPKVIQEMKQIGKMLNQSQMADNASNRLTQALQKTRDTLNASGPKTVFWEIQVNEGDDGAPKYSTIVPQSLEQSLLTEAGGSNIAVNEEPFIPGQVRINDDFIQSADPHYILIYGYEALNNRNYIPVTARDRWRDIKAVRENRILSLPPSFGSPSTLHDDILLLVQFLYQERPVE